MHNKPLADKPLDIARAAMRQLAASRISPTPENFARAYRDASHEASGAASIEPPDSPQTNISASADPEAVLSRLIDRMIAVSPAQSSALRLQEHISHRAWESALGIANSALLEMLAEPSKEWSRLLLQLLTQLDNTHVGWTRARKLVAVRHVLAHPASKDRVCEKLERLMAGWSCKPEITNALAETEPGAHLGECIKIAEVTEASAAAAAVAVPTKVAVVAVVAVAAAPNPWRALALAAVDALQNHHGSGPATKGDADSLIQKLIALDGAPGDDWMDKIHATAMTMQQDVHRQAALTGRLTKLLQLVCNNLVLFADDGAWVSGQVTRISALLNAPLDEYTLTEAEDSLRLAVQRQSKLKADLDDAKTAVKEMLTSLVDHLATAATSTSEFHDRIGEHAKAIRQADDMPSLSRVVANLLDNAVEMREGIQRTHLELSTARERVHRYEARVVELEQELVSVSNLVRVDPLTQVLNRRGLEEVFAIEQGRAERELTTLSVAMLDIDNFKCFNDSLGHLAGDRVLKHLSGMIRQELRPTDTVARYGGEEFVILLPATSVEGAMSVMLRVQRQLTRAIFLHNDEKILVTFSAGITFHESGDSQAAVIGRADAALYAAKLAGKNRVHIG